MSSDTADFLKRGSGTPAMQIDLNIQSSTVANRRGLSARKEVVEIRIITAFRSSAQDRPRLGQESPEQENSADR